MAEANATVNGWLEANIARGVQAAIRRREERERVERLEAAGVVDDAELREADFFDAVDGIHFLDEAWLEGSFIAELEARELAPGDGVDDDQEDDGDDGVLVLGEMMGDEVELDSLLPGAPTAEGGGADGAEDGLDPTAADPMAIVLAEEEPECMHASGDGSVVPSVIRPVPGEA